jgi:hypothetical protein
MSHPPFAHAVVHACHVMQSGDLSKSTLGRQHADLVHHSRLVPKDAVAALVAAGVRHLPREVLSTGQLPGAGGVLLTCSSRMESSGRLFCNTDRNCNS